MLPVPDYAAVVAALPYPILLIDRALVIIGANPAYLAATARHADELIGQHIFDAFPANPTDPPSSNLAEVRASIEIAISTRQPHTSALLRYAIPRTGDTGTHFEERYWSAVHSPVFDANGEVVCVAQNALDVTDLYRFDETSQRYRLRQPVDGVPDAPMSHNPQTQAAMTRILKDERHRLQRLFDQAPGFIAVLSGREHAFTMVNEAFYQLVGHRDLVGKPITEALAEIPGQGIVELLDTAFDSGQPIVLRERRLLLQRNSGAAPSECYLDLVLQPIQGADGRVTGIFAQGHEVTRAHQAHRALAEKVRELEEARQRQAFQLQLTDTLKAVTCPQEMMDQACALIGRQLDASRVLVGEHDPEHQRVRLHAHFAHGPLPALQGAYATAALGEGYHRALQDGRPWVCHDLSTAPEVCNSPEVGSTFQALQIQAVVTMPVARQGRFVSCLSVTSHRPRQWSAGEIDLIRDAAERTWGAVERARAVEALHQANQRKDQFLAMLAHELRNPLAPISAAATLLKMPGLPQENVASTSDVIARQVKHMTGLVNDLLDVSRVSTGLVVLERETVNLQQVISDAVEQARPLMESRRHQILTRLAAEAAQVVGDHKRLVQVVANLLNNAAKYTREGGTVTVTLTATGPWVVLSVQDNGCGIDADLLPHVFTLFSQAQRTPDRSQGGLGLGLALVRSLVELHGGSVSARSAGAHQGSEFTVRLPRAQASPQPGSDTAPSPHSNAAPPQPAPAWRVLIVDDNVDAAQILAMLLQVQGFAVDVEHDPHRALARARRDGYGAFLLDIGLPGMDGNELARRLRAMPGARGAVLVAITGYGGQQDRETSLRAGFDHYLTKPADPDRIVAILRQALKASADAPTAQG